ncbi:MAG TPA: ABC transporter permease [Chitinophagaceae bacterium]|nr:ABC transporter permease [Chitinophagaceae bacterium]
MFKNYFKTAWRNISANKLFTSLNVIGLAIGLCICILLFTYVSYELGFDRTYKNANNIYRVNLQTGNALEYKKFSTIPNAVAPALAQSIPQVKSATRLIKEGFGSPVSLKVDDKNFTEKGLFLADASVFQIFDFNFTEGNAQTAFTQPKSVVLSQSAKERLFGNQSAIGKLIYVNSRDTLHVSGIYKDLPGNSSINCDMIYNIMDSWMGKEPWWSNPSYETYCLLQPNSNIANVERQANEILYKNVGADTIYFKHLFFQPLTKIHLYSADLREGYASNYGDINNVKTLLFLSLLILFIGCINYMNLATAHSQKRAKGIGVNKVLGANIRQMLMLFYIETAVLSLIAIAIGYMLAFVSIPFFQNITGIRVSNSALYSVPVLLSLFITWLIVTIVAGSYPAFSLSHISPIVLMNKTKLKNSFAGIIRKTLVTFQFAASVILIVAVVVIVQQTRFMENKNLGYNPKGVVALPITSAQPGEISSAINDLKRLSGVENVSAVQSIPGETESGKSVHKSSTDETGFTVWTCHTDASIISTMQLQLLAGTTLPQTIAKGDTVCYALINEAVAKYLGFKTLQDAIGKNIITEIARKSVVTGVVKNFNYKSLKDEIGGYMYYEANAGEDVGTLIVRYDTHNLPQLMQQLQNIFKNDLPNTAFDYEFLDTHVQNLYASENHAANAATVFSLLAILIACLGLFGLVSFTAEQRTKEIGIRKVLGASVSGVTALLVKDFLKLVILAFILASPVAWWAMNKWLQSFAYRINISWWVFVVAGLCALFIALITVSFQSIKAALANPVKSLRTE